MAATEFAGNLLFADERGEEDIEPSDRQRADGCVVVCDGAARRRNFSPLRNCNMCVNAVLRSEATDVLNLGPLGRLRALKSSVAGDASGVRVFPRRDENLLITDGCQQSLDLISKAFVRPGDSVILENPTYPGAVAIFHGARARCLAVPVKTHAEPTVRWVWMWKRWKRRSRPIV